MSPITHAARERLEQYLRDCNSFADQLTAPERGNHSPVVDFRYAHRLIDDLIAAVRGEQPTDQPF